MPRANASGVMKLIGCSAYRIAALAPWRLTMSSRMVVLTLDKERSGRHSTAHRIAALAPCRVTQSTGKAVLTLDEWCSGRQLTAHRCAALAPWRLPEIPKGGDYPTGVEWHIAEERAQRCGQPTTSERYAKLGLAEERAQRWGQPTTSERYANCLVRAKERAQRCGSSDYA